MFNPYTESIKILATNEINSKEYFKESTDIRVVLEDANSPVTRKYQEKLYKSIIDKAHIDFGDIPKSAGNIKRYSGYNTMCETLKVIMTLAQENKVPAVQVYVKIVQDAIKSIEDLSSTYEKGFTTKTEYVAMEYDTYVYFCVEATTALIYSFVDFIKMPNSRMVEIKIKNTKLRADEFYFTQLKKFNDVQSNMGIEYRKMLEGMCSKDKNNFTGAEVLGVTAVMVAAMAIVPLTREVIYQIYNFRGKLSNNLEMQAQFLELNKSCVENNSTFDVKKKEKIIAKQQKLAGKLRKLSDMLRIKSSKSIMDSKRELEKDNKLLSIDNIRDEVSNSPIELI